MIQITENASAQIRRMIARRGADETGLRVGVKAGGCSGYEYTFGWEGAPKPTDVVFDGSDGAKVFVDPRSLRLLDGSVLDYDTSLLTKGFTFNNPHSTATCGCGLSFSAETTERPAATQTDEHM